MLLERAQGLADKISQYQKLQAAAKGVEQFRTREQQISSAATSLREAKKRIGAFNEAGIPISFSPAKSEGLIKNARSIETILEENPGGLGDLPFNFKYEFYDRVNSIASAASKEVGKTWGSYVAANTSLGSNELLDTLAKVPQLRTSVNAIRKIRMAIDELAKETPINPSLAIKQLDKLTAELKNAWSELAAEGIPKSVVSFIRKSGAEGAPLNYLTGEVHDWLESQDLLGAFRIRIG